MKKNIAIKVFIHGYRKDGKNAVTDIIKKACEAQGLIVSITNPIATTMVIEGELDMSKPLNIPKFSEETVS